jgi:hypothetical protein
VRGSFLFTAFQLSQYDLWRSLEFAYRHADPMPLRVSRNSLHSIPGAAAIPAETAGR